MDLNQEIKERFDLLYVTDLNVAKCHDAIYIESLELQDQNPEQLVLKLFNEYNLLTHCAFAFKRKDYLNFADCKSRLFNVFFARYVLFEVCEETELIQGLILNKKLNHIVQLFEDSKARLKSFTLNGFLNEEKDFVFYELNQKPTNTSRGEYYKMKNWQIQKKVECVNFQFGWLIEKFIQFNEEGGNRELYMDKVRSERQLLDELFKNANYYKTSQFIDIFSKLNGLLPDFLIVDKTEFHESFCRFIKGKMNPYAFSPQMLRLANETFQAGKIPNSEVFFLALIKYKSWLTHVLEGKIGLMEAPDSNYDQLFELAYEKGLRRSKMLIVAFKLRYPSSKFTEEKYKSIILRELNILRQELKVIKYVNYYQLLLNKENAKNYFIDHCFLDNDIDNQCCELRKAIVLSEMIRYFKSELFKIDESYIKPLLDINKLKNEFADIISSMVPNPTINDQMQRAFFKISLDELVRKPLFFIVEDLKDSIDGIFSQALTNLQQILHTQPGNLIAIFAVNQLVNLRCKALNTRKNGLEKEYFKVLKKFYKAHVEFIKDQHNCMIDSYESPLHEKDKPEPKPDNNKVLAFNYNEIKDDKLALVLFALIKLKAISPNTTLPQLRALFKGKEVTDPIEWLAAQGDLMVFIREIVRINESEFTTYNQHWNIAVKCFVKKGGESFDPQKLRFSKPTLLEQKFIEAARKFK